MVVLTKKFDLKLNIVPILVIWYALSWNYNTSKNNMLENSFIKVYWIGDGFEVEHDFL